MHLLSPRFLQEFWNTADDKKVIVFANTKATCDIVQRSLERQGYSVSVLHSGKASGVMAISMVIMSLLMMLYYHCDCQYL